jgi:hypothetical protein
MQCRTCLQEKDTTDFGSTKVKGKVYLRKQCKLCFKSKHPYSLTEAQRVKKNEKTREWKKQTKYVVPMNEARQKTIRMAGWKAQGMDPILAEAYFQAHDGKCEMCGKPGQDNGKALAMDHCHDSLKIRGMLCQTCNLLLGYAKDSPWLLVRALDYLNKK